MAENNLANLLNAMTETSVYVIKEENHRLLYFNKRCEDTGRGRAAIGVKCHDVWPEVCANCPLNGLGDKESNRIVCYDPLQKTTVDVTASRITWDGYIPAIVVTAAPHQMNFEEEQGLKKIEKMYAQSLVTVFDECIIANLTADYYVNCQKDVMWTDIPEQGSFGIENRQYARKVVHPDDLECFNSYFSREAMLRRFGEGKKQISRRLRRLTPDGSYHMVEFTAAKIGVSIKECWCVLVYRDIQDEYLMEQQRNVEISQLATAAGIACQMLIAVNLTKKTYHMLEYARLPVKQPADEGDFDDLIEFELATVHPDYRKKFYEKFSRQSLIDAFTGGERMVTMQVPHFGEDGSYHWNFTQVVRVESPYTEDLIEITLSRNIDEERRIQEETLEKERKAKFLLEDALQKAEKANQAKSEFLSKMSHDIRTPMNAVLGLTELARMHISDEDKIRDYLDKIAGSGAHLLGLINEVLDVSKIESGSFKLENHEFSLDKLMRDSAELIRLSLENRNQELQIRIEEGIHLQVCGDEKRLRQILVNILDNASKYTGEQGNIYFSLKELKQNEPRTGTYQFEIRDTGIGMKKDYLEHIFEPFSREDDSRTSRVSGTGLGMTIVKNLITIMGGDIRVESEYGKGTRFFITLCFTKSNASAESKPVEIDGEGNTIAGLRILLVEDNEINRQIAAEMLEMLGARIEIARNGNEAVEAVCSHPPLYYDLVFMDVQMPVMNGYDATRKIRSCKMERIEELPIIALTADAFAEDAKQAQLAGMNGHLAKPISLDQLRQTLIDCAVWKHRKQKQV
ncbi:ATP-binding protein [Anaerolentibacter hominis]|uniref:ATP-binding protein n=1 Tax=Anaerolentibacter hominis TaxID=3079009 RepID=UPI0031B87BD5